MAAKQAAQQRVVPEQESTGRFDRIRFDRVQMEVNLPGYDVNRAIARTQQKKRRVEPPPATASVVATPVVFGAGTPAAAAPNPQQPSPVSNTEPDWNLEL